MATFVLADVTKNVNKFCKSGVNLTENRELWAIMAENIELHSFRTPFTKGSDIEEYHEIYTGDFVEASFPEIDVGKNFNEFDFFSKHDVKIGKKTTGKKKKSKKKDKSANLMDIISTELATVAVPIEENVISIVDYTAEQRSSYLVTTPKVERMFDRRHSQFDSEQGWSLKKESVKINPTFPKVLENIARDDSSIPVQYIKPVKYVDLIAKVNNEGTQPMKFLDIEIKEVEFKQHHLFSLENLLCNKLREVYKEYEHLKVVLQDVIKDIKVNRDTRDSLKEEFLKISPNKKDDIRFDQTVRKYTKNLLDLKQDYLKNLQCEKELIHRMLSLWSDIEMIREKTGKTDTVDMLTIKQDNLSDDEFETTWNEAFNIEYSDMLDKIEYEYVNKYLEYKEVKYTQNLDDSTKRRISKPKLHIDKDTIKDEVEEIVNKIISKTKIDVNLKSDDKIQSEPNRHMRDFAKIEYCFEISVDDVFVCESDHFSCKNIDFSESFSIQILPKNASLKISILENGSEASSLMIDLIDIKKNNINTDFVNLNFVYNDIIEPNDKQIGSGHNIKEIASQNKVRLKSSNLFKGNLYTTCEVAIKMGWNENLSQNQEEHIKNNMDIDRKIKRLIHGIDKPTTDGVIDLICKIYNKDVSNDETVLDAINNLGTQRVESDDTFPIDINSPEFLRLKLLHLRNNGGMSNVENKMVPLHASQISIEQINCLQNSKDNDIDVQYFHDKYGEMDPIEIQRFIGSKYVQKLNKNMLKNLNEYLLRKTHKDVVRDFKDLSLRTLFSNQTNLSLANISTGTKQQMLSDSLGREQQITITILRAFNLPDRSNLVEDTEEVNIAGFKVRPLRPFVRVGYGGASAQTSPAIGCHPSWNQTLKITAKLEPLSSIQINIFDEHKTNISDGSDDETNRSVHYRCCNRWLGCLQVPLHSVLSLGTFCGTFRLTTPPMLFGYENTTPKDTNQSLVPVVTQLLKKETSFIALHITTTLSHLGGLQGYHQPIPTEEDYIINHINTFVTEYTNDFPTRHISLTFIDSSGKNKCVTQFIQPIIPPDSESFPKNPKLRAESALSKSSGLSKSSSSKSSGKSRREDRASYQEERESLYSSTSWKKEGMENQLNKIMNACVRYVSLIPTYEVCESHTVTLLGVELLKVLHGSPLDHTILLTSYFQYLGIRTWIAIGLGLPRGLSAYVLTKYDLLSKKMVLVTDQEKPRGFLSKTGGYIWYVYDAVSGERSELSDVGCPLKTVDFVFDNENIWVNMQNSLDCESVSFDFTRSSDWQPVFDKSIFVMKLPTLSDTSLYSNSADVERLRQALEAKIREKVQKWRSHMKTIWNRYCSTLLRETLHHWEYWSFNTSEPKPGANQRLKQLMVSYKMFGFPLNLPYVNSKSVISTVKSTGVHLTSDPNVEFGLAVEVYPYPNNVLSVWVFFASITRL